MTGTTVGVVGASGRAAAGSLRRAGFTPWVVDLFADRDTRQIAPVIRCPFADYPHGLVKLCESFPPSPVIYTGGLENHPDVIRNLATHRTVWGNPPDVLERVRDPFFLHASFAAAGLPVPAIRPTSATISRGRWVRKAHSSGGLGVRLARDTEPQDASAYMQEFIEGNPFSAQFFCVDNAPELVGVTEQLIGEPWLHAAPFRYAGNIGPVFFDGPVEQSLEKLAAAVTQAVGLEGPWGFDFILRDGTAYLLEVNPRYTAAMEVIELATHSEFFGVPVPSPPSATIGKAIYFAPHRIVFPASGSWDMDLAGEFDPWRIPDFADIPEPGEVIEPGWPVLTFFEQGSSSADVRGQLQSRAAELDRRFAESRS